MPCTTRSMPGRSQPSSRSAHSTPAAYAAQPAVSPGPRASSRPSKTSSCCPLRTVTTSSFRGTHGGVRRVRQGHRQAQAAVVVHVLADQVHPARGREDAERRTPVLVGEERRDVLGQDGGVTGVEGLHAAHCRGFDPRPTRAHSDGRDGSTAEARRATTCGVEASNRPEYRRAGSPAGRPSPPRAGRRTAGGQECHDGALGRQRPAGPGARRAGPPDVRPGPPGRDRAARGVRRRRRCPSTSPTRRATRW